MASLWSPSANIPDAIAESRRLSRLFLVYISGENEASRKMDEMWDDERVLSLCMTTCVAIKLRANSDGCKQFSAIYPIFTIPSAYFIDSMGKVVEAILAESAIDEVVAKVDSVTKPLRMITEGTNEAQQQQQGKLGSSDSAKMSESSSSAQKQLQEDDSKKPERRQRTVEERVEDEAKEETRHEKERREWGRNLQKLKEAQQEAKLKQDIDERKRNKLEEQAAKERVRRQIEQDKLDRAAKFKQEKNKKLQAVEQARSEKGEVMKKEREQEHHERNMYARLQFRLPDGSTLVETFDSTDVLQSAVEFLTSQDLPGCASTQSFVLAMAFPRRTFPLSDYTRTFADLGLPPSASLVVLPRQNPAVSSSESTADGVWSLVLFILMIPYRLLMYIWTFITGRRTGAPAERNTFVPPDDRERQSGNGEHLEGARRRRNMTRLRDLKGDDDDNATWNGNSTQQM